MVCWLLSDRGLKAATATLAAVLAAFKQAGTAQKADFRAFERAQAPHPLLCSPKTDLTARVRHHILRKAWQLWASMPSCSLPVVTSTACTLLSTPKEESAM